MHSGSCATFNESELRHLEVTSSVNLNFPRKVIYTQIWLSYKRCDIIQG